jgi:Sec-independent protein translocase protein TatA
VGFGTELLFVMLLGLLILGPRKMHAMLGHVARAKADFDKATRSFKSQLTSALDVKPQLPKDARQTQDAQFAE